jgi:gamma-glutamylputrescine oxidase
VNEVQHTSSYYAATATSYDAFPTLQGDVEADVVVIGGGYTGLSAALHLSERGFSVVLLEAARIGWGASGRNGGQLIPGLRKGAAELVRIFGAEQAISLFHLSLEAIDCVASRIKQHKIECDYKPSGHLYVAAKKRDVADIKAEVDCLATVMNYDGARFLDQIDLRHYVTGGTYYGGLLDKRGGHLHPLNYAIGLARAARQSGVRIYEQSAVAAIDQTGRITARLASGSVSSTYAVLACDAYLGSLHKPLAARMMPVGNYIIATEPLGNAQSLIPGDVPVSDSNFVLDYYRLSADKRLLFSGGEKYTAKPPADIINFVRPHMLKVFPQLEQTRIDYAWGGMVSVTMSRMPHFGREGNLFFAQGYSGQGVALTTLAGKLIAEAVSGKADRFDIFSRIKPPAFPGGALLRSPLYVLGMLWYALRDRL